MNAPDPIEKLLREQDAHIADDGFTQKVMAQVPRRRHLLWSRLFLLGLAVVGGLVAYRWLPWKSLPPLDYTKVFSDPNVLSAWLPLVIVILALASAAVGALRRED